MWRMRRHDHFPVRSKLERFACHAKFGLARYKTRRGFGVVRVFEYFPWFQRDLRHEKTP